MTQDQIQQHPFFAKFQQRLPAVVNGLVQRGLLSPNEQNVLVQMLRSQQGWMAMTQFIENLNMRYSEINDPSMDAEISAWIGPIAQQAKMQAQRMAGGFGVGGFNNGFGQFGGSWGQTQPAVGFGFDGFRAGMGRGGPSLTSPFAPSQGSNQIGSQLSNMFSGSQPTQRDRQIATQMKAQKQQVIQPPAWKEPVSRNDNRTFNLEDGVEVTVESFDLFTTDSARSVVVYDPKVGYTSDREAIEKYRPVFSLFGQTNRKFLTIFYQRLKAIQVPREELLKLAQAVATAAGRVSGVEAKLRAIIATAGHFNKNAYEEFSRLFIDELELHIQCGELCDWSHPKNILNRPKGLEDVLAWVIGDVGKDMAAAFKAMEGFEERLNKLLEVLIEEFAAGLYRRILNTQTDMTVLCNLYRSLPGMWTDDCGQTFKNTEDLLTAFLATRERVDGSKSASAVKAEADLKSKLDAINKQFSLVFVPRVATWCNYAKSDVCVYDDKGNCQPSVTSKLQPRNDVEYFLIEIIKIMDDSKDTLLKWAPRNIYMEIDEETFVLQYGKTTNGPLWVGTSIYWK